jgi:hypothetical protein
MWQSTSFIINDLCVYLFEPLCENVKYLCVGLNIRQVDILGSTRLNMIKFKLVWNSTRVCHNFFSARTQFDSNSRTCGLYHIVMQYFLGAI